MIGSLATEVDKLQISRLIAQLHLWRAFRHDDHYQIMHVKINLKTGKALAHLVAMLPLSLRSYANKLVHSIFFVCTVF